MPLDVTVIFDIGKTNKKVLLFNKRGEVVHEQKTCMDPVLDEDQHPCEDLVALERWIRQEFSRLCQDNSYRIRGLNFSTYGASLVHLDSGGRALTPLYDYLKPYPESLAREFYHCYGGRENFCLITASPSMGMLNSGLQIYRLKKTHPEVYRKLRYILHFPQYLSFLFSGRICTEWTSIGCHTAMWDFERGTYHDWIRQEELSSKLPELVPVQSTSSGRIRQNRFRVGTGIHDSSAALAPYLYSSGAPLIQLSTGTWSIAMNPFSRQPLTPEELNNDGLHYLNIHGDPVKASRLFLGSEYAFQLSRIGEFFERNPDEMDCRPDPVLLQRLARGGVVQRRIKLEKITSFIPEFPRSEPEEDLSGFSNYEEACHQLMLELSAFQAESIRRIRHEPEIKELIVTGGFTANEFFIRLLATIFPELHVFTSNMPEASALGAFLVMQNKDNLSEAILSIPEKKSHLPFEKLQIKGFDRSR